MDRKFSIDSRYSVGNLHVSLSGEFSDICAWELIKIIMLNKSGRGRIFVNTDGIKRISLKGIDLFKSHMCEKRIKHDWLYFKGDRGFEIAPDGSRVLICNRENSRDKHKKCLSGPLKCINPRS